VKAGPGDKVRVKAGPHSGDRGVIEAVGEGKLTVCLEGSGQTVTLLPEAVTNYSLAARKAWVTDPYRAVGRRKGTKLCDRVSVTLRLDRELWQEFRKLEDEDRIHDRTAVINEWFREKLAELTGEESQDRCPGK